MKNKKILLVPLLLLSLFSCSKKDKNHLTIAEVTHSLFYAPMYIAKNAGYFNDEGLKIDIITTPGADKVMASLLSKDAQIGLMGPEATIYVYQNGQKDYAVNFAQLTQKDGSFLMGREKTIDFKYESLKGKTIIGGRKGGMPEMILEYVLKKNGLTITQNNQDPSKDVNIRTDVSFDATSRVFVSGESDYVTCFEPIASQIEKNNQGYILRSLGKDSGLIPYTCFSSLSSYYLKNKEQLSKFTKAIKKGLDFIHNESIDNIIKYLKPDFITSKDDELKDVITSYQSIDAWPSKLELSKDNFFHLVDIIKMAGELDENVNVPYDKLVNNELVK